ncbi:MAG: hypothetical protein RLZZ127_624 [Planctomycetota bacterium]|jgi:putative flippase GtrA
MAEDGRRHLGRFAVVGLLSVATDLGVYAGSAAAGLPRDPAKGLGYLAGMGLGFILNKAWTFGSLRPAAGELLLYGLVYATTFAVNILVNRGILLGLDGVAAPGAVAAAAFLAATGTTTILNYLGMRHIAFRRGIRERRAAEGQP